MKILDFTDVAKKYKGMWVAFADSKSIQVVGYGKTLQKALGQALSNGYKHPVVSHMPKDVHTVQVGGFRA